MACCPRPRSRTCSSSSRRSTSGRSRVSREPVGVLCMAYGSPPSEEGIEAYYTHIRGGRKPSAEALDELKSRYRAIGGSPLPALTRQQAAAIGDPVGLAAVLGTEHPPPFLPEGAAHGGSAR